MGQSLSHFCLLRFLLGFFCESLFLGGFLEEFINAAHCVHQAGFAGVERMAGGASLGFRVFPRGSDRVCFTARAFYLRLGKIFRVDIVFHRLFLTTCKVYLKKNKLARAESLVEA